jgi:hypothetical protein
VVKWRQDRVRPVGTTEIQERKVLEVYGELTNALFLTLYLRLTFKRGSDVLKLIVFIVFFIVPTSPAVAYNGFTMLEENTCKPLTERQVQSLSPSWRKYIGFVKLCPLQGRHEKDVKVSFISVWAHEYLDAHPDEAWQDFPLPIVVNSKNEEVAELPELYPAKDQNPIQRTLLRRQDRGGELQEPLGTPCCRS